MIYIKTIFFLALRGISRFLLISTVYKKFGIFLPSGANLSKAEAITIGKDFGISEFCHLYCQDPENGSFLTIGNNVKLNTGVMINSDCGGKIFIGNDVLIGPYAVLRAAGHAFNRKDALISQQGHIAGVMTIEDDVWIGAGAVIIGGITIGRGAVIGAGSVVTKNISPMSVVGGVPAKHIKYRE